MFPLSDQPEEEEAAVLARPGPVGHGHDVVLHEGARGRREVVGREAPDRQLQLPQDALPVLLSVHISSD